MKLGTVLAVAFCLAGCSGAQQGSEPGATATPGAAVPVAAEPHPADAAWNTADADGLTNGNIATAAAKLLRGDAIPDGSAKLIDVMKKPWDYYGQRLCFPSVVGQVEDMPPGSALAQAFGGSAAEIVAMSGELIVDMLVIGGSGDVQPADSINVCGLVAGRTEVENRVGGKFRHLIMVGKLKAPGDPKR